MVNKHDHCLHNITYHCIVIIINVIIIATKSIFVFISSGVNVQTIKKKRKKRHKENCDQVYHAGTLALVYNDMSYI